MTHLSLLFLTVVALTFTAALSQSNVINMPLYGDFKFSLSLLLPFPLLLHKTYISSLLIPSLALNFPLSLLSLPCLQISFTNFIILIILFFIFVIFLFVFGAFRVTSDFIFVDLSLEPPLSLTCLFVSLLTLSNLSPLSIFSFIRIIIGNYLSH